MSSGGKRPGATRSGTFLQPGQAFLEKTFAPLANDLATGVQAFSDLVIGQTLGCMEDHFGANHLKIRQRIFSGSGFKFSAFLLP